MALEGAVVAVVLAPVALSEEGGKGGRGLPGLGRRFGLRPSGSPKSIGSFPTYAYRLIPPLETNRILRSEPLECWAVIAGPIEVKACAVILAAGMLVGIGAG